MVVGEGTSLATLANGLNTNMVLHSGSAGADPTFGLVSLAGGDVFGTLALGNGGTGSTSFTANALVVANAGATQLASIGTGTSGMALISGGAGGAPSWGTLGIAYGGYRWYYTRYCSSSSWVSHRN